MKTIAVSAYLFCCLLGWGAAWTVVPSVMIYALLHKWKKGVWSVPYSIWDGVAYVAIGYVWYYTYTLLGREKDWGNLLYELPGLGGLFGLLLCARLLFVWRHPEWKRKFTFATSAAILLAAVLAAWLVPDLGGC